MQPCAQQEAQDEEEIEVLLLSQNDRNFPFMARPQQVTQQVNNFRNLPQNRKRAITNIVEYANPFNGDNIQSYVEPSDAPANMTDDQRYEAMRAQLREFSKKKDKVLNDKFKQNQLLASSLMVGKNINSLRSGVDKKKRGDQVRVQVKAEGDEREGCQH